MKIKRSGIVKTLKISFFSALCLQLAMSFALAAWPAGASAQTEKNLLQFEPQIQIPNSAFDSASVKVSTYDPATGELNSDLLAKYIQAFYNYGMAIVGILAAIVLMGGGVLWLTSGGDSGKIGQAKELIMGSIIGTGILFSSWIILNTVNPELLNFRAIKVMGIAPVSYDGADGILDNADSIPADAEISFLCLRPGDTCENTNPPTININVSLCYGELNVSPISCTDANYPTKWCCAKSASSINTADAYCQDKTTGVACKLNETASMGSGYCENNKCVGCKKFGEACSGAFNDHECVGYDQYSCGIPNNGDCNCNLLLSDCTCKKY